MAGPSSELMALSLALAPVFWQCLALFAEAVFPSWQACRALFSCGKRKRALSTVSSVHSSHACHDREAAVYGCPSTAPTGWNRAEQPSCLMPGTGGEGRKQRWYLQWCTFDLSSPPEGCMWWMRDWRQTPQLLLWLPYVQDVPCWMTKTATAAQTTIKCVY